MRTIEEVAAEIRALPSADAIADFLRARHIRGKRKEETDCPLARYIRAETGKLVSIGPQHNETGEIGTCAVANFTDVDHVLCTHAHDFYRAFDDGTHYGDLQDDSSDEEE